MARRVLDGIARRLRDVATRHQGSGAQAAPDVASLADQHAAEGDRARDRRDWSAAAAHYRRALEARPTWPAIRVQLGHMLKESGQVAEAEAAYRQALEEDPGNADTCLQLGHALKLQHRPSEAEASYLAALVRKPDLQPARDELKALGLSRRVIDQHIAAMRPAAPVRAQDALHRQQAEVAGSDAALIEPQVSLAGSITEIGLQHVAGIIHDVAACDLPLTLVCRAGDDVVATSVIEAPTDAGASRPAEIEARVRHRADLSLPGDVPFRIELPAAASGRVLRIRLEPMGFELNGSPFLALGSETSTILDRLERLELAVDRGGISSDLEARLTARLAGSVLALATTRIEAVLDHQRATFERMLVVAEGLLAGAGAALGCAAARQAGGGQAAGAGETGSAGSARPPTRSRIEARAAFPGLGWSQPEHGRDGRQQRWMLQRGSLSFLVDAAPGYILRLVIVAVADRQILGGLRIGAAGCIARHWIEPATATPGPAREWLLTALLPGQARQGDGSLSVMIDAGGRTIAKGAGADRSMAVRELELDAVPAATAPDIELRASAPWFAQSWVEQPGDGGWCMARERALIVLPAVEQARDARLVLLGDGLPANLAMTLNEVPLSSVEAQDGVGCTASISAQAWRSDAPNLLALTSPRPAPQAASAVVHGVTIVPA